VEPAPAAEGEAAQDVLQVGVATGQTGYLSVTDGPSLKGLQLGVDEVNAAGGIDGKWMIELDIRNTESDPTLTTTVTQQLIDDGAQFITSPCDLDPSVGAGQVGQAAGVPVMGCGTTPTMTDIVGDFMFGSWYGDNVTGYVLAKYARDLGYETAYLHLSPDTTYTNDLPEYFGTAFEDLGGTVLGRVTYGIDQSDFSANVTTLKNLDPQPDVVFTSTYEPQLASFLQQYRAAGVESAFFAAEGFDTPAMFELSCDVINDAVYTTAGFETPGSPLAEFNAKYEEKYGEPPGSVFPAVGYDIVRVLEAALKKAGSTDGAALRDAIASLENVQGATGLITYAGTNRMPVKQIALIKVEDCKPALIELVTPPADKIPAP